MGYQELLYGCTPGTWVLALRPGFASSGFENFAAASPHTPRDPRTMAKATRATAWLEMPRGAGSLDGGVFRCEKSIRVLLGPCGLRSPGCSMPANTPETVLLRIARLKPLRRARRTAARPTIT